MNAASIHSHSSIQAVIEEMRAVQDCAKREGNKALEHSVEDKANSTLPHLESLMSCAVYFCVLIISYTTTTPAKTGEERVECIHLVYAL